MEAETTEGLSHLNERLMRRRGVLGALAGGMAAIWTGVVPGFRSEGRLQAESATISSAWIDFDFPKGGAPLRRVILNNRAIGKIPVRNGRRFGLVPSILPTGKEVEVSVFDLAYQVSPNMCVPKLLKRLRVPVDGEMIPINVPDDQGFRFKVSHVTRRTLRVGENGLPIISVVDGEAFDCSIDCCVHCADDPPGQDTCGGAVCCNIPCGTSCGTCSDPPPADQNPCGPPPL